MGAREWQEALEILRLIPEQPDESWMPVYRGILHVCCRSYRYEEAKSVWSRLPRRDVMSFNMLMSLCGRLQRVDEVHALLSQMEAEGVDPSGVTYTTQLNAWAQSSSWEQAISTMEGLKAAQPALEPTTNFSAAYLSLLTAVAM